MKLFMIAYSLSVIFLMVVLPVILLVIHILGG